VAVDRAPLVYGRSETLEIESRHWSHGQDIVHDAPDGGRLDRLIMSMEDIAELVEAAAPEPEKGGSLKKSAY
jgi:hypothetical protein